MTNEEKIDLIQLRLDFWTARLQESLAAINMLNDLGNQLKIDSNSLDIDKYNRFIQALEQEKITLTNQV